MHELLGIFAHLAVGIAMHKITGNSTYSTPGNLTPCVNPLPGLERMNLGIDITKLDLKHDYSVDHLDGFTNKIFELTCSEGKKWVSPDPTLEPYDVPDQVDTVISLPAGLVYSATEIHRNMHELRDSMAAEAGISSVKEGLFSASLSYKQASYSLVNTSEYMATSKAFVSTTEIKYIPSFALRTSLSKYLVQMLGQLPAKYEDNPLGYQEVLETYGTHYYDTGYFGGTLMTRFHIQKEYIKNTAESEVKANAEATFFGILKAHGAYEGNVSEVSESFKKSSRNSQSYFGGVANLFDKEGYSKWWPTVAGNPWLYGGNLRPLSDLLPSSDPKQSAVKQAIDVYLLKAYLREIEGTAESFLNKGYVGDDVVRGMVAEVENLLNNATVTQAGVDALAAKISDYILTPDWFTERAQFCVNWLNPAKGFRNRQCAKMPGKTPDWDMCDGDRIDMDCFRGIGFEFSAPGAPSWWAGVSGTAYNPDPAASDWPAVFMLNVPAGAPGRMLNIQFCFYKDYQPLCSRANGWTPNINTYHNRMFGSFGIFGIN